MSSGLGFFTPRECQILEAMAARMVGTALVATAAGQFSDAVHTMDTYAGGLPPGLRAQLRSALRFFQWGPILFSGRPRPFTRLSIRQQEAYIRTWAESRLKVRRRVFRALRDLAFLGCYSQPGLRELIGHTEDRLGGA